MIVKPVAFHSNALNRRMVCYVGLPDDYEQNESKRYPVVYLLHGKYGTEICWLYKGNAQQIIEEMIEAGDLRDVIVVMPNDGGDTDGTYYSDWYDGSGNYEQYMIYDLVPFIDGEFRTQPDKFSRVIGGLSMGGFGAFMLSLKNSDLFGAAVSFSGALGDLRNLTERESAAYRPSTFSRIVGPAHGAYASQYNLKDLVNARIEENSGPALYFSCGKDDFLYEANVNFAKFLERVGYNHQYEEFEGDHNWKYWQTHLSRGLEFFESYFENQTKNRKM